MEPGVCCRTISSMASMASMSPMSSDTGVVFSDHDVPGSSCGDVVADIIAASTAWLFLEITVLIFDFLEESSGPSLSSPLFSYLEVLDLYEVGDVTEMRATATSQDGKP